MAGVKSLEAERNILGLNISFLMRESEDYIILTELTSFME